MSQQTKITTYNGWITDADLEQITAVADRATAALALARRIAQVMAIRPEDIRFTLDPERAGVVQIDRLADHTRETLGPYPAVRLALTIGSESMEAEDDWTLVYVPPAS